MRAKQKTVTFIEKIGMLDNIFIFMQHETNKNLLDQFPFSCERKALSLIFISENNLKHPW